ncbi:MAG: hypothetical protein CVU64_00235 [Deltaproteobacteria bacterium HGW-Deltaproteobacteria-21]|nr:MAG: hypothetical protein CVU64_00235 [Deltaproteobacteria bacterium HGW-Deltaproteobacteria-21]
MIETNIRIVEPGADLRLEVRICELSGQDLKPKTYERACDFLRSRHMAAVPSGGEILLLAPRLAAPTVLEGEDWRAEVHDSGHAKMLVFSNKSDAPLMAQLLERRLLVAAARQPNWWKLDSARIWYEKEPFKQEGDMAAYRRFEVSSVVVEGVGVGLVVDIGTAFFTTSSVADFFRTDLPQEKQEQNRRRFDRLGLRQKGQKATLLYDCGKTKSKCYFEKVIPGETCATTGERVVKRKVYPSLFAYYRECQPSLRVLESEPVARVSFAHIDAAVPVASNRLYLRLMNDVLPRGLGDVDKIKPGDRRLLIQRFWDTLGSKPLGESLPSMRSGFWQPPEDRTGQCKFPSLLFGGNTLLPSPHNGDWESKRDFFRRRLRYLKERGCFHVPATVTRGIHLAVPGTLEEQVACDLGDAISKLLSKWTMLNISVLSPQVYTDLGAGIEALKAEGRSGLALFVFEDQDPAAYYTVASELKGWRVKRITTRQLQSTHEDYATHKNATDRYGKPHRAVRAWKSFAEMCALDLLQQLSCVPYRPADSMKYDAHLAIDVGHDRRYYALSLLICRATNKRPHFWIDSLVEVKADPQKETINEVHLKNSIVKLFGKAKMMHFDQPLDSLFILRDGRECGRELDGIRAAKPELVKGGFLKADSKIDLVDFHKKSLKGIRLWDCADGQFRNVVEGTYVLLGRRDALLSNTGSLTLHQGTAEPVMLSARTEGLVMLHALSDVHTSSQLNWSSPGVAQSLPLEMKRTDEQLESRTAQEIKRIR